MGYRKPRKLYHLTWPQGHELHELELEMRGLSIEQLVDIAGLRRVGNDPEQIKEKYAEVFALFASKLVSWTLEEDDGTPVPATAEGVQAQVDDDPMFMVGLVMAWADAIASVDTPLLNGSSSGGRFPEASIPMAPPSPSPSSS
jgi:hypothetical protein